MAFYSRVEQQTGFEINLSLIGPLSPDLTSAGLSPLRRDAPTARESGCNDLIRLKNTSTYPATAENTNILSIPHMRELFGCEIGLSDHTMDVGVSVTVVAHGATVIEKHFTLNRSDCGVDSAFSLEPAEMTQLVAETKRAWQVLGQESYGPTDAELPSLQYRRSLYVVENIKACAELTRANMHAIRPGLGLPPKYLEVVLGRTAKEDVKRGTALNWQMIR